MTQDSEGGRASRATRALLVVSQLIRGSDSVDELVATLCEQLVTRVGYGMAWLGRPQGDGWVRPVGASEGATEYLKTLRVGWRDDALGDGPTGVAIRTGRVQVMSRVGTDPRYAPWAQAAQVYGFRSSAAVPVVQGGQVGWVLNLYGPAEDTFDAVENELLEEVGAQLGMFLGRLQAAQDRGTTQQQLDVAVDVLHAVYRASPDVIFLHDAQGRVVDVNERITQVYGFTPQDVYHLPVQGAPTPGCSPEDGMRQVQRAMAGEAADFEWMAQKKDGTWFPVEVRLRRLDGVDPERPDAPRVVAIVRDLTERKRMERELLRVEKLDALGVMASGIAHDFNNMLTAVLGNLSMASMDLPAHSGVRSVLADAEVAALHGRTLTRQLAALSRGELRSDQPVDLAELVRGVGARVQDRLGVQVQISSSPGSLRVRGDGDALAGSIQSMVVNAVQAGGAAPVQVHLRTQRHRGEADGIPLPSGDYVVIQVMDRGCGISPAHLKRIFDPFFTTRVGQQGLGLASCGVTVRQHRGHISCESREGEGTTFTVWLPQLSQPASTATRLMPSVVVKTGRALVMDDQDDVRLVIATMLERLGYQVTQVAHGDAAIQAAEQGHFDVAMLDLVVPDGMGGHETALWFQQHSSGTRLIAASGYTELGSAKRSSVFDAFLPKPFRLADMQAVLGSGADKG